MKVWQEFKDFAVKGNVVDLAVGIIIGVAFGKIVSSLVADILMPPIGVLIGGVDFSQMKWILKAAEEGRPEVAIRFGLFLQNIFDFIIVAAAVFGLVKLIQNLKRKPISTGGVTSPVAPEVQLLTEIRDLLRHK